MKFDGIYQIWCKGYRFNVGMPRYDIKQLFKCIDLPWLA